MEPCEIRRQLEAEYDIPFVVLQTMDGGEPAYIIGPENNSKELFVIKVYFRNRIRLYMDFLPEKYSAKFIESMATQPADNRSQFVAYADLLRSKGAKVDIRVNDTPLNLEKADQWPTAWVTCQIHVTKMPVFENGENYSDEAYRWGSIMMGMVLSLANIVSVEDVIQEHTGYAEGDVQRTEANRYERNPLNRKLCLSAKGYDCAVCGMNFEKEYGELGHNFIHVHHIIPVSKLGSGYIINPLQDLIPVCPNCHAMLHRTDPPLTPDSLRGLVRRSRVITGENES